VATIATALFQADTAGWKVKFVVDDENFFGRDFVKIGQRRYRLAGAIHEGWQAARFRQRALPCRKTCLGGERSLQLVG
jgi:hypothetical protein